MYNTSKFPIVLHKKNPAVKLVGQV